MKPRALVLAGANTSKLSRTRIDVKCGAFHFNNPSDARNVDQSIARSNISTSTRLQQAKYFTASPFSRSDEINVSEKFSIRRELKQGADYYGVRRYLLVPRDDDDNHHERRHPPGPVVASLNANKNIIFGAQLHLHQSSSSSTANADGDGYVSKYLAACGSLLDVAKEDAAINGQQVQALATLNGLCLWVEECLGKDGEGSEVLTGLMHGEQQPNLPRREARRGPKPPGGKRANQRIRDGSAGLIPKTEEERTSMVDAVRAIATGRPRPGHSVVGAGTYRDGERGWTALAREYAGMATAAAPVAPDVPGGAPSMTERVGGKTAGPEEVALYGSRGGLVTRIEHLAHTQPEYLREAGGAMARMFFV